MYRELLLIMPFSEVASVTSAAAKQQLQSKVIAKKGAMTARPK
jgi:hypothetical protein